MLVNIFNEHTYTCYLYLYNNTKKYIRQALSIRIYYAYT